MPSLDDCVLFIWVHLKGYLDRGYNLFYNQESCMQFRGIFRVLPKIYDRTFAKRVPFSIFTKKPTIDISLWKIGKLAIFLWNSPQYLLGS